MDSNIATVSFVEVSFAFKSCHKYIMSVGPPSAAYSNNTKHAFSPEVNVHAGSSDSSVDLQNEVFDATKIDPVLAKKMALINEAIEEIGMTPFQWKLFFLNGFGYAVDSVSRVPYSFHCRLIS